MYIRWIVRRHKNEGVADVTFHDAYLVESYRDDQGEPRQRTLAYLGNIRQIGTVLPGIERELFLLRAQIILNSIPGLSSGDCDHVQQQLYAKVPPLSADEMMTGFYNTLRWYFERWHEMGGAPPADALEALIQRARTGDGAPQWSG